MTNIEEIRKLVDGQAGEIEKHGRAAIRDLLEVIDGRNARDNARLDEENAALSVLSAIREKMKPESAGDHALCAAIDAVLDACGS